MSDMLLHVLLTAAFALVSVGLGTWMGVRRGLKPAGLCLYGVLAAALGLFLGRAIYCAVEWYNIFLDEMGGFAGMGPFFDPNMGSVNVIGLICGVLLAAPIAAAVMKESAAEYLDIAAVPGLMMYALGRVIEPLTGQGYGDFMEIYIYVCYVEAALTVLVIAAVLLLRGKVRRPGTLMQYALTLLCLSQIFPEALRFDNVLYVFVFCRVTHLGMAVLLGLTLIRLLVQGGRKGLAAKEIVIDAAAFAAGIGLCIASIFALDKTNWPKLLVYAMLLLSLIGLGVVICRRIHKEDIR